MVWELLQHSISLHYVDARFVSALRDRIDGYYFGMRLFFFPTNKASYYLLPFFPFSRDSFTFYSPSLHFIFLCSEIICTQTIKGRFYVQTFLLKILWFPVHLFSYPLQFIDDAQRRQCVQEICKSLNFHNRHLADIPICFKKR